MLDRQREYATIYGSSELTRFIQDGRRYAANGQHLGLVDENANQLSVGHTLEDTSGADPDSNSPGDNHADSPLTDEHPSVKKLSRSGFNRKLQKLNRTQMLDLALAYGLKANGRTSEDKLRAILRLHNASLP